MYSIWPQYLVVCTLNQPGTVLNFGVWTPIVIELVSRNQPSSSGPNEAAV